MVHYALEEQLSPQNLASIENLCKLLNSYNVLISRHVWVELQLTYLEYVQKVSEVLVALNAVQGTLIQES